MVGGVTIQDLRRTVAAEMEALKPQGWEVSVDTNATIRAGLIHVGHVADVTYRTFCEVTFDLFVTLWVNEAEDVDAADHLYRLISPGEDSLLTSWYNTSTTEPGPPVVETVGAVPQGPTGFLAAVLRIPLQLSQS